MDRMDRELGFKEPTVSDWRKIFKFVLKDGVAILTDYKGTDPVVVIPEKIGKNPVEVIEWEGFECCDVIREVTIPGSMKEIRFMAFCRCHNLEVVRFLPGVKTTGDNSFWLCSNLKHVYLPASVVEIRSFYQNQYTIHAPAGSYAEIYAKENGIPFVAE